VRRHATWLARLSVAGDLSLLAIVVYDLVSYFQGGREYLLVLSGVIVLYVALSVPRNIRRYRTYMSLADRLQRAAIDTHRSEAVR